MVAKWRSARLLSELMMAPLCIGLLGAVWSPPPWNSLFLLLMYASFALALLALWRRPNGPTTLPPGLNEQQRAEVRRIDRWSYVFGLPVLLSLVGLFSLIWSAELWGANYRLAAVVFTLLLVVGAPTATLLARRRLTILDRAEAAFPPARTSDGL